MDILSSEVSWEGQDKEETVACLEQAENYSLMSRRLYRQGADQVLRLCPETEEYTEIMAESQEGLCGIHASTEQTIQKVLLNGFWWPTLEEDVYNYVNQCPKCVKHPPVPYATLYSIMGIPDWASYIVEYLTKGHTDPDKPRHRKMQIEVEARDYTLVKGQFYKCGKDGNL